MFDHIGRDLDEEAARRGAASFTLTLMGLAAAVGFAVTVTAYTTAEVLLAPEIDEPMVELLGPDELPDPPLPGLPPPPPPAGPSAEEASEPDPEDAPVEPRPLEDRVEERMTAHAAPPGQDGGVDGGHPDGRPGGVPGGVPGGEPGGDGGGGPRILHHSELVVKRRVAPEYPPAARALDLGDQRCVATVTIDREGVPRRVEVSGCPKVFEAPTRDALLGWRWVPAREGRAAIEARTTIAVNFRQR